MAVVLLAGASGFIGGRLRSALRDAGHRVIAVGRGMDGRGESRVDFTRDTRELQWRPRLTGVDVVVNAAGVFADRPRGSMRLIHAVGPKALFSAAAESGVRRVIQISALGADSRSTEYFQTKDEADRHLMALPIEWAILRPSLVFGLGARSAASLLRLATRPALMLPRAFRSSLQPLHIDDLVAAVLVLVATPHLPREPVPAVGAKVCSMLGLLDTLRRQLGYASAITLLLPDALVRACGMFLPRAQRDYLSRDALRMLRAGYTANPTALATLLGRWPRSPENFVPRGLADGVGAEATLTWVLPLLRLGIAAVWIWLGLITLGVVPAGASYAAQITSQMGFAPSMQAAANWSMGLLELMMGVAALLFPRSARMWLLQIMLTGAYVIAISILSPGSWLQAFGTAWAVPLLAAMYLLRRLSLRRWAS
jgi:nucleoside-diphosphate-sugar epimerase